MLEQGRPIVNIFEMTDKNFKSLRADLLSSLFKHLSHLYFKPILLLSVMVLRWKMINSLT